MTIATSPKSCGVSSRARTMVEPSVNANWAPWAIVVTKDVVDALGDKAINYDIQLVGQTFVKGREQPVELYRVVDPLRVGIYRL